MCSLNLTLSSDWSLEPTHSIGEVLQLTSATNPSLRDVFIREQSAAQRDPIVAQSSQGAAFAGY